MLVSLLIKQLSTPVNRILTLDPAAASMLAPLHGKRLLLRCTQPEFGIYIDCQHAQLQFSSLQAESDAREPVPDTTLEGSASAFLALFSAKDPTAALARPDISLRGDPKVLELLQQFQAQFEPDFEAPLALLLGDIGAHTAGRTLRSLKKHWQQGRSEVKRQLQEYLQHEARLSPSAVEIQHWQQGVQHSAQHSERLQARIDRLKQKITS